MFTKDRILYEDNHLLIVNKKCGELVQQDSEGSVSLEDEIKEFIKRRDSKPGGVFLGVVHRIDRPVSGAVLFAKTGKALARLNEMMKERRITKRYWAVVESLPEETEATLEHHVLRDGKSNRARAFSSPRSGSKPAIMDYRLLSSSGRYYLLEVMLHTGRHHQIRAQLSKIGSPILGDLKYGSRRSVPGGGIFLHSRSLEFAHPVTGTTVSVVAPVPEGNNLWHFFGETVKE